LKTALLVSCVDTTYKEQMQRDWTEAQLETMFLFRKLFTLLP